MKQWVKVKEYGFTLIEMMLVAGIVSSFLLLGARYMQQKTQQTQLDRAAVQMQQIMNAGLSYYVNNGSWPADIATLQTDGYLPAAPATIKSPWGSAYTIAPMPAPPATSIVLQVSMSLPAGYKNGRAIGQILAGKLAFGTSTTTSPITITGSVNIPGQNLNNASSVNFAALYHNGGCVPVPKCPVDSKGTATTPEILVVPASASGMNDLGSLTSYPITSVTAFAMGTNTPNPPGCGGAAVPIACPATPAGTNYWRVCLRVITTKGVVTWDNTTAPFTAEYATVMAMTRCAISGEPSGSAFTIFGGD